MISEDEVIGILKDIKNTIESNWKTCFFLVNREKNRETFDKLDITPSKVREIICNLQLDNYSSGPLKDEETGNKSIYVFGIMIDNMEVYVKLKINELGKKFFCTCISFHESEFEMTFPFKGSE